MIDAAIARVSERDEIQTFIAKRLEVGRAEAWRNELRRLRLCDWCGGALTEEQVAGSLLCAVCEWLGITPP